MSIQSITNLNSGQHMTSVVFIDGSLPDLQSILSGLDPSVTAIVLDPALDGLRQMADALAGVSNLSAIHVISHGSRSRIKLGTAELTQDILPQYQTQLTAIGNALSSTGDLLLYGCNVAQGDTGQAFISALASATGADVAASTDLTGAAFLGGNWVLEANTGSIEAASLNVGNDYQSTLSLTVNDIRDAGALSLAAYVDGNINQQSANAWFNLSDPSNHLSGWQYVSPAAFGVSSNHIDSHGYYSMSTLLVDAQALLAYNASTHTLAISFRGTESNTDRINDANGGSLGFRPIYDLGFANFVSSVNR